jgi:ferredoxin
VPPGRDTSQWRVTLSLDRIPLGDPEAPTGPAARAGSTLCFDGELPDDAGEAGLPADAPLPLCGVLIDGFDGSRFRLPCRPVRWSPDSRPLESARESLSALLGARSARPLPAFLDELDTLARRSRDAGLPSFAVRVELIAVHFLTLEGTTEALADAEERLARLPAWVDGDAAGRRGAQAAYGRAEVALSRGSRAAAWTALETAARRYVRIGDGERIGVALQQADLLAGAGATVEGRTRLEEALADCSSGSCPPGLVTVARRQLAWLTLLDPLATAAENQLCPTAASKRTFVEDPYYEYTIDEQLCIGCAKCVEGCNRFGIGSMFLHIRHDRCVHCNECAIARTCPGVAFRRVPTSQPYLLKTTHAH